MKLPHCGRAQVDRRKVEEYLLSPRHPVGRSKARFFNLCGFSTRNWEALGDALRRHAAEHEVSRAEESPFGMRYAVDGIMRMPNGSEPAVRSVWFIEAGEDVPRLVTAYPLRRVR